ncbi:MAG: beta-lactamase family protein [Bacteroidales bacterium]|nr:beta-lactamase family protein [Bacteroidales bacterium]
MKKIHLYRALALVSLLIVAISSGRGQEEKIVTQKLDSRIHELIQKYNIPDADVRVIKNDSVIYRYSKNSVNANKNYLIGSCSKSFTSLSVMILSEKGRIDIDKPVLAYLPWFELKDIHETELVTVRHLLNHTSGIGSQHGFFDYPENDLSLYKSKLTEHLRSVVLINKPGEGFCYSNLNYLLLGLIVEEVTNQKYTQFLSENVFAKIGMNKSFAGFNEDLQRNTIQSYQYMIFNIPHKTKIYPHSDYAAAYGYLSSNVTDLCNYLTFMLNRGVTPGGDTLIGENSYNNLITPAKGNYAMGWMRFNNNKKDIIIHTGLDENYSAIMAASPEDRIGIVVLSNINSLQFCSLVYESVMDNLENKPFTQQFSFEIFLRWLPGSLAVLTLILLFFNLYRWNKYSMKIGIILKPLPIIRLIIGIGLSFTGVLLVQKYYSISILSVINYQPDIVMSFIFILLIGSISSIVRYLGTYSKINSTTF